MRPEPVMKLDRIETQPPSLGGPLERLEQATGERSSVAEVEPGTSDWLVESYVVEKRRAGGHLAVHR